MDNDIVRGRKKGRKSDEKNGEEEAARARAGGEADCRLRGREMTPEERNGENNGEFNMAPRGSFNHLIESPACLGSPPSFAPYLVVSSSPLLRRIPSEGPTIT